MRMANTVDLAYDLIEIGDYHYFSPLTSEQHARLPFWEFIDLATNEVNPLIEVHFHVRIAPGLTSDTRKIARAIEEFLHAECQKLGKGDRLEKLMREQALARASRLPPGSTP